MTDWNTLEAELDTWQGSGRTATFWWRDDDAVSITRPLQTIVETANRHDVPLALAVIPKMANQMFADYLATEKRTTVLQHGYAHTNHAPSDEKKAELGAHRSTDNVLDDLMHGQQHLECKFEDPLRVLVPPWNRIAPDVLPKLNKIGITGLSTFQPRRAAMVGLTIVNTHIDIMDWRGTRGFAGMHQTLGSVVQHLQSRRAASVDPSEPTGVLTHHLVHDEDCWQFLHDLFSLTQAHPAARWLSARDIFASNPVG